MFLTSWRAAWISGFLPLRSVCRAKNRSTGLTMRRMCSPLIWFLKSWKPLQDSLRVRRVMEAMETPDFSAMASMDSSGISAQLSSRKFARRFWVREKPPIPLLISSRRFLFMALPPVPRQKARDAHLQKKVPSRPRPGRDRWMSRRKSRRAAGNVAFQRPQKFKRKPNWKMPGLSSLVTLPKDGVSNWAPLANTVALLVRL